MEARHGRIWRARCSALGYSFDERTEFNSEYEVEHAVASGSDPGEFEVEQFYVDRAFSEALSARGGLFLMPFGFLNEHHEPTRFYGVQRNFVETLIIPSTWREGGFNLHGDSRAGLGWNLGLTTGFDLSKWDFAPAFPPYTSALALANSGTAPLQATHQELALAERAAPVAVPPRSATTAFRACSSGARSAAASRARRAIRASRCGRRMRAGCPRSSTCRRCTRAARSATPGPERSTPGLSQPVAIIVLWILPAGRLSAVGAG